MQVNFYDVYRKFPLNMKEHILSKDYVKKHPKKMKIFLDCLDCNTYVGKENNINDEIEKLSS